MKITIDDDLKQKLLAAEGSVELCDRTGALVGRATPPAADSFDPWPMFADLTEEKIDEICREPVPRLSTEQVVDKLRERM